MEGQFLAVAIGLFLVVELGALTTSATSVQGVVSNIGHNSPHSPIKTGKASLADVIHHMKLNRPKDGNRARLNDAEVREVLERIRSSEYLGELRGLGHKRVSKDEVRGDALSLPWKVDPDCYYNMSGLIWSKGYPVEEYKVQTEDGYILGLFRIPRGKNNATHTGPRPVVFLQHGLLSASTNWVENPANEALGFILADAGYDVWMGNSRGNTYSRKHVTLDPNQREFWEFSWDQMAKYDLPAMLNFALTRTNQSQLAYIGHSQGTLVAFTGLSMNPELAKKVTTLIALGPVYTVGDITGVLRDLVDIGAVEVLADFLSLNGIEEFLPTNFWINQLAAQTVCAWPETEHLCEVPLFILGGYSKNHLNASRVQVYVSNEPAGTSLQNMEHFTQMVQTGTCRMFDYGPVVNKEKYNSTTPPDYHVEKLTVPVALFWGANDDLADPTDVKRLIPRIPHLIYNREISNFEHLDFIWAFDARTILYNDVLSILRGTIPPKKSSSK